MQPLRPVEFQERLVDRQGLNQRRQILHHRPYLPADPDVFFHVRTDDHRFGTGFERLEHRHRRAHAVDAGDVTGGGDNATLAAADDERLVQKLGIVAFFDRRIKGVAVDMGKRQVVEFVMIDQPRAAAGAATPGRCLLGQAVAAETGIGLGLSAHVRNKG